MKLITFGFLILVSLSSALSIENVDQAKNYMSTLFDKMDARLTIIKNGLIKDKKTDQSIKVESNRLLLRNFKENITSGLDFVYKNTQYWQIMDIYFNSLVKDELKEIPDMGYVIHIFHNLFIICYKIEDGTKQDNRMQENKIAEKFRLAITGNYVPIVGQCLDFIEHYKNYKIDQLLSNYNFDEFVDLSDYNSIIYNDDTNDFEFFKKISLSFIKIDTNLIKIRDALMVNEDDNATYLELNRLMLKKNLSILRKANVFRMKHRRFWDDSWDRSENTEIKKSDQLSNNTFSSDITFRSYVLNMIDTFVGHLYSIENGLIVEYRTAEAFKAKTHKSNVDKEVRSALIASLNYLNEYKNLIDELSKFINRK